MLTNEALEQLVDYFIRQQKHIRKLLDESDLPPSERLSVQRKINMVLNLNLEGDEKWINE